ncbi:hypothetical protein SO694_00020054 [Aureococcus anophagefferens]|uniref:Centrosomal protein of 162 kDa n=1 Tax=Aureococcus anophagefferens TaxID=44056 RepID=A0ABR1FTW8_AURAN
MLRNPSETSTEASTRQDRRRSSMQLLKADLAALKARTDDGDGRAGDVAAAVKDQLATYLADLRDEASGGDQDAAEVRAELRALQLSIAEMREESPRPDLPAEAPTPAMLEIQRELGHLSEQLKQAMPSPNTAHRRASFQVMKAELDQLKSAQRNAPDAAEMLKETMRDYVDQIRGDAAEGDREIIRAELGTLADRLSEVAAAQRELLSPRERAADPALLELSDQLAQLRRDMVTQQQQRRRPSSSSQRPSMVALREDVEALRSRREAAPREALDAVRGDFQRFVEELRSDFTRTSTDERDAMRVEVAALHEKLQDMREDQLHSPRTEDAYDHLVEQFEALRADLQPKEPPKPRQSLARRSSLQLVKAELADLKRRKNSEHLSADALDAVQGNLKSYVDDLRRDMVASGDRDEMRGELHALQSQIAQLAASPRLAEAPVPSAASLEARIQPFLAEQLAPVLAELRKPPPVVQLQLPQQQTERPGRRSSLASVKADLAQLRHNQHDRVSKESIVRSVQSGLETYVKDLRADASAASDAERNGMREEIAVLQRALNDARADAAAQHAHSDHGAADHSALIAVQAKLDALSAEFRAPPAQARQHRRSSFSAMKRGLELLKRKRRVSDASPSASPLRSDASESERRFQKYAEDLRSGLVGAVSTAEKDEIKAELRQLAAEMRSSPRSQPADDEAARTHDDAMASMRAELESLRAEVARPRAPTRDKRRTSYAAMKHDLSMLKKRPGMDDEAVRQQAVESLRGDLKQYADDLNAGVVGGTKQDREEMRDELRSLFQEFAAAQQDLAPGVEEAKEPDEASRKLSALTRQLEALQSQVAAQQPAEARRARETTFNVMKRDLSMLRNKDRLGDQGERGATAGELERVKSEMAAYAADLRSGLLVETNDAEKEKMREEVRALKAEVASMPRPDDSAASRALEQLAEQLGSRLQQAALPAAHGRPRPTMYPAERRSTLNHMKADLEKLKAATASDNAQATIESLRKELDVYAADIRANLERGESPVVADLQQQLVEAHGAIHERVATDPETAQQLASVNAQLTTLQAQVLGAVDVSPREVKRDERRSTLAVMKKDLDRLRNRSKYDPPPEGFVDAMKADVANYVRTVAASLAAESQSSDDDADKEEMREELRLLKRQLDDVKESQKRQDTPRSESSESDDDDDDDPLQLVSKQLVDIQQALQPKAAKDRRTTFATMKQDLEGLKKRAAKGEAVSDAAAKTVTSDLARYAAELAETLKRDTAEDRAEMEAEL